MVFGFKIRRVSKEQAAAAGEDVGATRSASEAAAPGAGASGPSGSYESSLVGRTRYEVEHSFVPEFFFSNPTGFIDQFTDEYGFHILYALAYKEHARKKIPYWDTEFASDVKKLDSGDYLAIAELPAPELYGLCYRMFFLFDTSFTRLGFFTVELEEDGVELYQWEGAKERVAAGEVEVARWNDKTKEERDEELKRVVELYEAMPAAAEAAAAEAAQAATAEAAEAEAPETR